MTPPGFLHSSLLVALGGGAGAWLRHTVGRAALAVLGPGAAGAFPWATLACNVAGSFAMGLLAGWLGRHGAAGGETWRLLLGVGLLGGFTTFSSFSLEFVLLVQRGAVGLAAGYAAVSVIAAIGGLLAGMMMMRVVA
jgi:CrcB protein